LQAGLILLGIRAAIGVVLLTPGHFGWKHKSVVGRDVALICAIFGMSDGALGGAILFDSHSPLAKIGGAVAGGALGFLAGIFLGAVAWGICAIAKSGQTNRPHPVSSPAQRRALLIVVAALPLVAAGVDAAIYLMGSNLQRQRVMQAIWMPFAVAFAGIVVLMVKYRRTPVLEKMGSGGPFHVGEPACFVDGLEEFSTNFDSEHVRPFLLRIQPLIESGFGPSEIGKVCELVESLAHDEEGEAEFRIRHEGSDGRLRIRVHMDDIDSPDIYFFAPSALRRQIEAEFERFANELGI
jgi:hypothetical protein